MASSYDSFQGSEKARTAGRWFVFAWFFVGGLAHFAFTAAEMRTVPPWVPWPREVVWITGAFELLGAAGLLVVRWRRLSGIGLFILTLLVTPANIYMLQASDRFDIPVWLLWLRLPLQVGLLYLIASTCAASIRSRRLFS